MKRWLLPSAVGVALLLLIPVFVVFTPPVRGTWDPVRREAAVERGAERDAPRPAAGGTRAGADAPVEFFGSLATRAALEAAVRQVPARSDGVERQWSYAVSGDAWRERSPLEMSASDVRRCKDGAGSASCIASGLPASVHGRVIRVGGEAAEVAVVWVAGARDGALTVLLVRSGAAWRVLNIRDGIDPGAVTRSETAVAPD